MKNTELSYKEAAKITGLHITTLYHLVKSGKMSCVKTRHGSKFTERGLRMFVESDEYNRIKERSQKNNEGKKRRKNERRNKSKV